MYRLKTALFSLTVLTGCVTTQRPLPPLPIGMVEPFSTKIHDFAKLEEFVPTEDLDAQTVTPPRTLAEKPPIGLPILHNSRIFRTNGPLKYAEAYIQWFGAGPSFKIAVDCPWGTKLAYRKGSFAHELFCIPLEAHGEKALYGRIPFISLSTTDADLVQNRIDSRYLEFIAMEM